MAGHGVETGGVVLRWGTATDTGNVRGLNEDAVLADAPMFVVADGMGGHEAGELASSLTVELFRRVASGGLASVDEVATALAALNGTIHEHGSGSGKGMGTTAVGIVLVDYGNAPSWLLFNVGDSRAYCLAHDRLQQLSVDHSYVQELVQLGELSPDDAKHHPNRNVITRALGAAPDVDPDYWLRPVEPRERFLLCSDGLTTEVEDGRIEAVLREVADPDAASAALVEEALRNGGRDNVSVVVLDVVDVTTNDATSETHPRVVREPRGQRPPVITSVPGVSAARAADEAADRALLEASHEPAAPVPMRAGDAAVGTVPVDDDTSPNARAAATGTALIDGLPPDLAAPNDDAGAR